MHRKEGAENVGEKTVSSIIGECHNEMGEIERALDEILGTIETECRVTEEPECSMDKIHLQAQSLSVRLAETRRRIWILHAKLE